MQTSQLNLLAAWSGILLGFVSGLVFGLFFHREGWLGGYSSFKRRLYRLGHISFFGLAVVNFMFYFTAQQCAPGDPAMAIASWAFLAGAVSMPLCCLFMAHFPRTHLLFGVPVLSLLLGAILTVISVTDHASPVSNHEKNRIHRHERRARPQRRTHQTGADPAGFCRTQQNYRVAA